VAHRSPETQPYVKPFRMTIIGEAINPTADVPHKNMTIYNGNVVVRLFKNIE
jgi:hypothetical protein